MTTDENVVVMDRCGQEILTYQRVRFDPHLRTAEVLLELTPLEFYIDR